MENSAHLSCISPAATSDDSSWALYIANFLASSSHNQEQEAASDSDLSSSTFSSSFASPFVTSEAMPDDDDDSLEDTACSSATSPKVLDVNLMVNVEANEITTQEKYLVHASSQQSVIDAVHEVSGGDEKRSYECNELRKKGLCLVPLSMLIDYLG